MTGDHPLAVVARVFDAAGVAYAIIGGHAVNAWLEPRMTLDVDITAQIGAASHRKLEQALIAAGFSRTQQHGGEQASGPEFERYRSADGGLILEIQAARTDLQRKLIERSERTGAGPRIATPEDLLVLKLIANRPKDQADLTGLLNLPGLDMEYVERWAREWGVDELLRHVVARARGRG